MGVGLHKDLEIVDTHGIVAFEYADAAARTGAVGLVPADVNKVAHQLDTNDFYVLLDDSPVTWVQMGGAPSGAAGGSLTGTYPNPTIAALAITDAEVAAANKDGIAATPSMRTLGTGAQQAASGTDSRLSDSRAPTGTAGGNLSGTYPNPSVTFATAAGGAPPTGSAGGSLTGTYPNPTVAALAITDAMVATANKDGIAATPSMRTLGTGAQQAVSGTDSRLSDSRAPNGSASGDLAGSYPSPTVKAVANEFAFTSLSTATLTADQNNWAAWSTNLVTVMANPNANPRTVTGITGGAEGRIIIFQNISATNSVVFSNESGSSTAANRITSPNAGNITAFPGQCVTFKYSAGSINRWIPQTISWAATTTVDGLHSATDKTKLDALVYSTWVYRADDFDIPTASPWPVTVPAALTVDSVDANVPVIRFDSTTEEGAGFDLFVPANATSMRITFVSRAQSTPAGTVGVQPSFRTREFPHQASVEAFAEVDLTPLSFPTTVQWQTHTQTQTIASFSLVAGRTAQIELTRQPADGDDTLASDWVLKHMIIEFV